MVDACTWSRNNDDDSGMYETTCKEAFLFSDGTPKDNSFRFCCYCGKPLVMNHYTDDDSEGTTEVLGTAGVLVPDGKTFCTDESKAGD